MKDFKRDFPILRTFSHGKKLTYLDSAASAQKPKAVLDEMTRFMENDYANIHRGVYLLSQTSTKLYEEARETVKAFLNAKDAKEVIFVRGTTEGLNLIAQTFGKKTVGPGDEVLISEMEHHSNIVPWQMLCKDVGAFLKVAPIKDDGTLDMDKFKSSVTDRTKLISITHVSNALGTVNPIKSIVEFAHAKGIRVVVDGAQSIVHFPIDVQALGCDFFVFSGHKLYGPTGIGALYGKREHLETMPPYQGGGEMIESVTFERSTYKPIPEKFEAGTPNIVGAVGLMATIRYLRDIGFDWIREHEKELMDYAHERLATVPGIRIIGTAAEKSGVISFVLDGIHPHDIATILDHEGIAVRAGHHCAQPIMDRFKLPATTRASFALYNTKDDVDVLISGLGKILEVFK